MGTPPINESAELSVPLVNSLLYGQVPISCGEYATQIIYCRARNNVYINFTQSRFRLSCQVIVL
jgi:hypothetical protein